jgi:hypothetical protein
VNAADNQTNGAVAHDHMPALADDPVAELRKDADGIFLTDSR